VADVKLLNFFRYMSMGATITVGLVILVSVFVQNFWCRYLCPYGALLALFSLASPVRIRRSAALCIDCAKCARDCPAQLPVDRLIAIRSAECTACMQCVAACPAAGALELSAGKRRIPAWMVAAAIAIVFFGVCGWAQWTGHWDTDLPARVYLELVPRADEFRHP
jgi:polyferredoxin